MVTMKDLSFDKEEFKIQLGKRLRHERTMRGWTLQEAEKEIGISFQKIHNHEEAAANVLPFHLVKYSLAYKKPVSHFFGSEHNEKNFDSAIDKKDVLMTAEYSKLNPSFKGLIFHLAKEINKLDKKSENKEQVA